MHSVVIALVLIAAGQGAAAPEKAAVIAPVRQFVEAFNKGDAKAMAAVCEEQISIIDEFPPHEWHGAGGVAAWMTDFDADAKKNGITDAIVTVAAPKHVDIAGDRAYVVVPADTCTSKTARSKWCASAVRRASSQRRWRPTTSRVDSHLTTQMMEGEAGG